MKKSYKYSPNPKISNPSIIMRRRSILIEAKCKYLLPVKFLSIENEHIDLFYSIPVQTSSTWKVSWHLQKTKPFFTKAYDDPYVQNEEVKPETANGLDHTSIFHAHSRLSSAPSSVRPIDMQKTTFTVDNRTYEFIRLLFWQHNSPTTFQKYWQYSL